MRDKRKSEAHPRSEGTTSRLQALADGVFAVAMTVLALGLPESTGHSAADTLRGSLPHLLLYFVSMLGLGALWFGHRNTYEYVRRTDHPHTWLSLAELAFIPLVPWTVSVLAHHLTDPAALTAYNANLAIICWFGAAAWWYAIDDGRLTGPLPRGFSQVSTRLALVPAVGFTLVTGIAWLSGQAALVFDVLLPLLPVTGLSYRLQYRLSKISRPAGTGQPG